MDMVFRPMMLTMTLPLLVGVLCLLLPRRMDGERALVSIAGAAITLFMAWTLFTAVRPLPVGGGLDLQVGAWFDLRLDHLGAFVLLAISAFGLLISIYSLRYMQGRERLREYYAYLLFTLGISCGVVLANDLILLLVCWGLLGVTLYMLIGMGGPEASAAAKKSLIITGGADCFLLLGVVILLFLAPGRGMHGLRMPLQGELSYVAFLCFAVAAFAKAGAMPLHSWVPDCGEKAPMSVVAFLPASLDKLLGIYLLARTVLDLFVMNGMTNAFLMIIGAGTVLCAVMMALVQHDLKRLLSYHAVSQVGYMVLGIGSGALIGIAGGLFHMLNNALYKSCLFLCAGAVERKVGTTDMDRLGGLAKLMPLTFGSCFIAALAISGVPPLNGFTSKWMIYQGIIESGQGGQWMWVVFLATAMLGSALTLASFVKVLHAVFLCKPPADAKREGVGEVSAAMWVPTAILAALCVLFGVLGYRLVLRPAIFPALAEHVVTSGAWRAGPAAVMLFSAFALGLIVYGLTTARRARTCETYIGGELLAEADIPGEPQGATPDVEMTGVDFYRTVEDLPGLRGIYNLARRKVFDLYDVGTGVISYAVEALRAAHTGRLPTYLTWLLAGFLGVLWLLVFGSRFV